MDKPVQQRSEGGQADEKSDAGVFDVSMLADFQKLRDMQIDLFARQINLELSFGRIEPEMSADTFDETSFCEHFPEVFQEKDEDIRQITSAVGHIADHMSSLAEKLRNSHHLTSPLSESVLRIAVPADSAAGMPSGSLDNRFTSPSGVISPSSRNVGSLASMPGQQASAESVVTERRSGASVNAGPPARTPVHVPAAPPRSMAVATSAILSPPSGAATTPSVAAATKAPPAIPVLRAVASVMSPVSGTPPARIARQ